MNLVNRAREIRNEKGTGAFLGSNLTVITGFLVASYFGYYVGDVLVDKIPLKNTILDWPVRGFFLYRGAKIGMQAWPLTSTMGGLLGYGLEKIVRLFTG